MKLADIQQKLKAPKSQFNKFGGYKYRNCEDILEALKPLLGDSIVTISDEIVQIGNRFYVKASAKFYEPGADNHKGITAEVTAYARESEDKKGMDAAQITGAASSYARKYALNGLFLIDDTQDADTQDNREQREPVKYEVARVVPNDDDGETPHTGKRPIPERPTGNAAKLEIAKLLKDGFGYTMVGKKKEDIAKKVLDITNIELEPANYAEIIEALKNTIAQNQAELDNFER